MGEVSPYDQVSPELMHSPEALQATADALRDLSARLVLPAGQAVRVAASRQSKRSAQDVLMNEARVVLRSILDEDELESLFADGEGAGTPPQASDSLSLGRREVALGTESDFEQEWLGLQTQDLAATVAALWWGLGVDSKGRRAALTLLHLDDSGANSESVRAVAQRFGLEVSEVLLLLDQALASVVFDRLAGQEAVQAQMPMGREMPLG